MMTLLLEVKMK